MPKVPWINIHKEKIVKLLEAIVVILGIGSSVTLSTKHHIWGIWLAVAAVCIIAVVIGIILTVSSANKTDSSVSEQSSEANPMNSQSGQGNVNAPNNQGNINTGPVGGNLNQVVNVGSQDRKLSDSQIADLQAATKPFLSDSKLEVFAIMGDRESTALAQQIVNAVGLKRAVILGVWPKRSEGIRIVVRTANSPPPLAEAIRYSLARSGFQISGSSRPEWPESDNNKVVVEVHFNPSQK